MSTSPESERPTTLAEMLSEIAGWMDMIDKILSLVPAAQAYDLYAPQNCAVQDDCRSLSAYFRNNPQLDKEIYAHVFRSSSAES